MKEGMNKLTRILEALIFASDRPLSLDRLTALVAEEGHGKAEIAQALRELRAEYVKRDGGISLEEVAGGYRFSTHEGLAPWVKRLAIARATPLSLAALEVLAIIAYRQPIIKMEIDRIRGVDCGGVIKGLLERRLVRIVGRKDAPGRPMLYGTTAHFLELFHLRSLAELPTVKELTERERLT